MILQDNFIFITFLMKVMKNNPPGAEKLFKGALGDGGTFVQSVHNSI
jgi:hypothetical protein